MTNEQIFAAFLKKHRKYSSFKRQTIDDYLSRSASIRNCIVYGFNLIESEEGRDFWLKLLKKWRELVSNFKLEGSIDLTKI